jgi:hypothetical protein
MRMRERARVSGPSEGRVLGRVERLSSVLHVECVGLLSPHADYVPLLVLPEDTCCRRCDSLHGTSPDANRRTDQDPRSSVNPRRLPVPRGPGCLPPLRARVRERIAPPVTRAGLPLTPPTRSPHGWGQCAHRALQALLSGEPEDSLSLLALRLRESRFAFTTSCGGLE